MASSLTGMVGTADGKAAIIAAANTTTTTPSTSEVAPRPQHEPLQLRYPIGSAALLEWMNSPATSSLTMEQQPSLASSPISTQSATMIQPMTQPILQQHLSITRTKSREAEQERAAEAVECAASFLHDFDDNEQRIIHAAIWGDGPSKSIVAESGMDTVERSSMRKLQPGMWLNDEIVHYFYLMLAKRDAELCSTTNTDPETTTTKKLRSHFFKSFFITKLLNEGSATNDGEYEYRNVKSWSQKVPGEDIFALDKIFVPINIGNMHWISAVIFMQKKRIEIFDSMGSKGRRYLEALFQYLQDEHLDKEKTPLPDMEEWKLVPTKRETPRQHNGYDCGVFVCFYADLLSMDLPLTFDQSHINHFRERVALSIIKGKAIKPQGLQLCIDLMCMFSSNPENMNDDQRGIRFFRQFGNQQQRDAWKKQTLQNHYLIKIENVHQFGTKDAAIGDVYDLARKAKMTGVRELDISVATQQTTHLCRDFIHAFPFMAPNLLVVNLTNIAANKNNYYLLQNFAASCPSLKKIIWNNGRENKDPYTMCNHWNCFCSEGDLLRECRPLREIEFNNCRFTLPYHVQSWLDNPKKFLFHEWSKKLQRVSIKNALLVTCHRAITAADLQAVLVKFVRNSPSLRYFSSDLTTDNITMLQTERPGIHFV